MRNLNGSIKALLSCGTTGLCLWTSWLSMWNTTKKRHRHIKRGVLNLENILKAGKWYTQPVVLGVEHGVSFGGFDLYEMDLERLVILAMYDFEAAGAYKIRTSKLGKYLEGHDR